MKPGYKQTEVGVIPEEWDVKLLPEVLRFRGGKAHEQHITETGRYICVNSKFISTDGEVRKYSSANFCPANRGDVLMVMSDLPNGRALAKAYLVEKDDTYTVNQRVCALTTYSDCPEYLFYVLNRHPYFLKFDNGVSQTHLLNNVFQKCPIPVPPNVEEQRAIATALSDVDALLAALDRLIAKKRDLKQAAMQQLLTGQTRLPGFHGEWEVKRLGDVGEISSAGVDKKIRPDEVPVRLVNYLDVYRKDFIYSDDLNHWVTAPLQQAKRCAVLKGDVFFTPTSETRDDIGISAVAMEDIPDAAYSYHVARLRLHEPWDLCFRTYAFKTRAFLDQAKTLCDGNGTRYVISQGKFRSMTVQVPPFPEQTAIASVLSEMDGELAVLEQRREKTRALKQAMMQELLTGRTRLV
jgi:type I restriction enzyme S subunit